MVILILIRGRGGISLYFVSFPNEFSFSSKLTYCVFNVMDLHRSVSKSYHTLKLFFIRANAIHVSRNVIQGA